MSKKVALLVTAEVQTRIVVDVADNFDVENIKDGDFCYISEVAKERLAQNLCNDIYDCVTEVKLDTEVPYTENEDSMAKSAKEVREKFAEENMYCEIYEHENGCISIEIEWGDWKHDHAYSDYLMMEMGYECTDEQVTEENGSDCYSSVHFYEKMED